MKPNDHTASCNKCAELQCEVRSACYDDVTATEPREEILEEITFVN